MTGIDVLVHVKASKDWTESVNVGLQLAQRLEARAHGLITLGELARTRAHFGNDVAFMAERVKVWESVSARAEARFRESTKRYGVEGTWLVGEGAASELLCLVGRVHDLLVVEQGDPGVDEIDFDPAEEAILAAGVPTLVVPKTGAYPSIGKRIAIAWNHSREAAQAVRGALPLLQRAQSVIVISGERKETFRSIMRAPQHDLVSNLRRKGIPADDTSFRPAAAESSDAALLSTVREAGADMLVMGAYGRSWLRELLLGGTTRHAMKNMELPILFAH